jgi:hypothetical protein
MITFLIIPVSSQYDDDDFPIFDYKIQNNIYIYNDTRCNQTLDMDSIIYSCPCSNINTCLVDYFKSHLFNSVKVKNSTLHQLCNINFTNTNNYNRCIPCHNNTSIDYNVGINNICNGDYSIDVITLFIILITISAIGAGLIYLYYSKYNRRNYNRLNNY